MKRREFLSASIAAALATALPFRSQANALITDVAYPAPVAAPVIGGHDFKNRLVTIMGSSKPETCEANLGRFFSATPSPTRFPTFSFSDNEYLVNILQDARPKDDIYLISFVGRPENLQNQHMKAAMRHDPDLFIFEQLAGADATISPQGLQQLIAINRYVAGSVRADTEAELFDVLRSALGNELDYLISQSPKIQVFHDMKDVTQSFVEWSLQSSTLA